VVRIVAAALGFRVISAIIALLVNLSFPLQQHEQFTVFESTSPFWDTFARYDSGWYYQIATNGYTFVPGGPSAGIGKPGKIAFFPLYPVSMQYTGRLFGTARADVYFGGILVSWMSFIAASVALFFLARLDLNRRQAERTVLLTAIFPFSFFFGMVYTGSAVSAAHRAELLRVPDTTLDTRWTRRRAGDGDTGERHPHVAGAGVDCVSHGAADRTRSPARRRQGFCWWPVASALTRSTSII
jgi:hypothetical protein